MRPEFANYQRAIVEDYHQKIKENRIPQNLVHLKTPQIRQECLDVFDQRYQESEEDVLKTFFGRQNGPKQYRAVMETFDVDKFRQIAALAREEVTKTDHKNVELLAWLIDFQTRPFTTWLNDQEQKADSVENEGDHDHKRKEGEEKENNNGGGTTTTENEDGNQPPKGSDGDILPSNEDEENGERDTIKPGTGNENPPPGPQNNGTSPDKKKIWIVLSLLLILVTVALVTYLSWPKQTTKTGSTPVTRTVSGQCMYWTGENYQAIPCSENHEGAIPLDSLKLTRFKKVTRQDTVTRNSIRKLWYFKIKGGLELYTDSGIHPGYPDRRLLPLSAYMWEKYLRK